MPPSRTRPPEGNQEEFRLKWWGEPIIILSFYGIYTMVRNQFGSELGSAAKQAATENAHSVIALEKAMHLFVEEGIQKVFINWDWFIRFWNIFYGTCHFVVTISVMVLLFLRSPARYGVWRTILASTTALALVGFTLYPLMPPRLLNDCGDFGACETTYSFVDTLKDPGGFWSFGSTGIAEISNQYAAMPSLHIAWAFWCMFAVLPVIRRHWVRIALLIYPWTTVFAVIVTANHYWIDAVGGLVVLFSGYLLGTALSRVLPSWLIPPTTHSQQNSQSNNSTTPTQDNNQNKDNQDGVPKHEARRHRPIITARQNEDSQDGVPKPLTT